MRRLFLLSLIVLTSVLLKSQNNLDSLYTLWQDETQEDSVRSKSYGDYIWSGFLFSNPDSAIALTQDLLRFGKEKNHANAEMIAYQLRGVANAVKSDYPKALTNMQRSLKISEELGDKAYMAKNIQNIGNVHRSLGNQSKALSHYQRSLKLNEELGHQLNIAKCVTSIGVIYADQEDFHQSLEYFERSLQIHEELGDKANSANVIGNIGNNYRKLGDEEKALEYLQRSLEIREEIGDRYSSAIMIFSIGAIHQSQGDYSTALSYGQRSLAIQEEIGDIAGSAKSLGFLGSIHKDLGDYGSALENCEKSLSISQNSNALSEEKNACQCLYDTYKAMGKGDEALEYLERIQKIDDTLNAQETAKELQLMEFQKQVLADSLATAEEARLVEVAHQEEVRQKNRTRNWLAGGGILAILLAVGFYSRWRYVRKSKANLQVEKDRSENLLLNILPEDIANELKEKGRADARDFEMVSILFTDFKGFTAASEKLSAQDLVSEINTCFEAFDGIMGKYDIEKIKTIGDAYMAAGGLLVPTDDSVKHTVLAALEMQDFINDRKANLDAHGKPGFEMRVGLHTGPVVAGIVGVKKFQYDIWGDTVNTASRMESSGEVGKVNISEATYELLKDDATFTFESRGKVEAKGKGEIEMYFVSRA